MVNHDGRDQAADGRNASGDVVPLRTEGDLSRWELELRRLGEAILHEPVPNRLRSICASLKGERVDVDNRASLPGEADDKETEKV